MPKPPQETWDDTPSVADGVNLAYGLSLSAAMLVRPFLRVGFGVEVPGFAGLIAFLVLLGCAAMHPALTLYFLVWLVTLFVQRVIAWWRQERVHSHYGGYPWLGACLPWVRSERAARRLEVWPCAALAVLLPEQHPLTLLLFAGALGTVLANGMEEQANRRQARRLRDARIEAGYLSRLAGGGRDEF